MSVVPLGLGVFLPMLTQDSRPGLYYSPRPGLVPGPPHTNAAANS
jgi:hypothetical protein